VKNELLISKDLSILEFNFTSFVKVCAIKPHNSILLFKGFLLHLIAYFFSSWNGTKRDIDCR